MSEVRWFIAAKQSKPQLTNTETDQWEIALMQIETQMQTQKGWLGEM